MLVFKKTEDTQQVVVSQVLVALRNLKPIKENFNDLP